MAKKRVSAAPSSLGEVGMFARSGKGRAPASKMDRERAEPEEVDFSHAFDVLLDPSSSRVIEGP